MKQPPRVRVYTSSPPPALVLIGIVFMAGACALAWLSSLDVMTVTRTTATMADVAFDDELFGLVRIGGERIAGVRSARVVIQRFEGSGSSDANTRFLAFDTENGEVFADADRHYFERYAGDITAFIADPARNELVLRTSDEGRELIRFLFAQACVLLLAMVGWFAFRMGLRAIFPGPNERTGPA
jgi:hypothetical protein